jgi:glycine/D-amino acid oxidase-like deaminating enzyme
MRVGIVGGGVFGLAAALELNARGHVVTLVEQDLIPAEKAASNDASKTIQRLYGRREHYVDLVERAECQWRSWQDLVSDQFYFPVGHLLVTRDLAPGSRAYDSYETLTHRGNQLQYLSIAEARQRFPQIIYHWPTAGSKRRTTRSGSRPSRIVTARQVRTSPIAPGPSSVAGCPDWLRVSFSVPVPASTTTRQTATS